MRLAKLFTPLCALSALALTGCSADFNPKLSAAPGSATISAITGTVFGGRQPISGARVFLFAAGMTANAGPGIAASSSNKSTSLLTNSNASGYQTAQDTDSSSPTYLDYYVTSDSNGRFGIGNEYTCASGSQVYIYSVGGDPGSGVNSAAGMMAVLGNCPGSGSLALQVPVVSMNEMSTVAAAFAFSAFATDATHVSSSGLGLQGMINAFANSGQMYQIDGGGPYPSSALLNTPAGNGTLPQQKLNSLSNILATCINSTGPGSLACTTLLGDATSNGTGTGTAPTDTATAAINIAHHPGANVADLIGLQPSIGAVYLPDLPGSPTPNDFAIAIYYTDASLKQPAGIAVDQNNNVWVMSCCSNSLLTEMSPLGVSMRGSGIDTGTGTNYAVVIDSSDNIWAADGKKEYLETNGQLLATVANPCDYPNTYFAADASNNLWYPDRPDRSICELPSSSSTYNTTYHYDSSQLYVTTALDASLNIWAARVDSGYVVELKLGGTALVAGEPTTGWSLGYTDGSYGLAIDRNGNAWVADNAAPNIAQISPTGTLSSFSLSTGSNGARVVAVDGANTIWTGNGNGSLTNLDGGTGAALSPAAGYLSPNTSNSTQFYIAVDFSGNIWAADGTYLMEFIGIASPVWTPLVNNVVSGTIGTRP